MFVIIFKVIVLKTNLKILKAVEHFLNFKDVFQFSLYFYPYEI